MPNGSHRWATAGIGEAVEVVRRRIESVGGDPSAVRIVAVTKGFGPEAVKAAVGAGVVDVGENYAQELVAKAVDLGAVGLDEGAVSPAVARDPSAMPPADVGSAAAAAVADGVAVRWHFLGKVQRNKVPALAPLVWCWQGIARASEGEAIATRRPGAHVLVQVDVTGDPARNGCDPHDVPGLVRSLQGFGLDVRGLMAVAPVGRDAAHGAFRVVRELADRLGLPERSIGMSDDLETAVAEGSTMLRLGRALFGPRPPR